MESHGHIQGSIQGNHAHFILPCQLLLHHFQYVYRERSLQGFPCVFSDPIERTNVENWLTTKRVSFVVHSFALVAAYENFDFITGSEG